MTNAIKYGGGGRLRLDANPHSGCLVVTVEDRGPGIDDVDLALQDGFADGHFLTPDHRRNRERGLGLGLGAVRRLSDDVVVTRCPHGGARIEARFFWTGQPTQNKPNWSR